MPEQISGQAPQPLVQPQGHAQAASPAGQGHTELPPQFAVGAFNEIGVDPQRVIAMHQKQQTTNGQGTAQVSNGTASTQVQPAQQTTEGTQAQPRQLTEKDERHFAQFVTKAAQDKYELAKALVEADAEAIFNIADRDKDLAERLVKEFDLGADSLEELLQKKTVSTAADPEKAQQEIEDARWKAEMEKQLMDEKILRLKGEDPDLNGETEEKLRELWSDKAFSKYDEKQKVAIAKTLTGKSQQTSSADNVALAILQREQGVTSSPRGATNQEKMKQFSPEFRAMQKSMGVTDAMMDVLPPDIEEQINAALGPWGQR